MYSGLLDCEIRDDVESAGMPDFFIDLNLNQIVRELQNNVDDYDIRKMYYKLPENYETVCYRQEIYREIRGKHLEKALDRFSEKMRETRKYKELHEKAADIPEKMAGCLTLESDEAMQLYALLHKMINTFQSQ